MDYWQDFEAEARHTERLTLSHSPVTVDLLRATISLYAEGLGLATSPDTTDASLVRAGLISQNFNSLKAAVDLACRGYYIQSIGVLRGVYENWLAFWYLSHHPEEANRWLESLGRRPPKAETMKNKIPYPSTDMKAKLGNFYKELCLFSHTGSLCVIPLLADEGDKRIVHHGVQYNAGHFLATAYSIFLWAGNMTSLLGLWIHANSPWHHKQRRNTDELLNFTDRFNAEYGMETVVPRIENTVG